MTTAAPPAAKATGTAYVVLRAEPKSRTYTFLRNVTARNGNDAIKETLVKTDGAASVDGDFSYVAVPARSFQPVSIKIETKTTIKLTSP